MSTSARIEQIISAMNGRLAAQANDPKLRDEVRVKVMDLSNIQRRPMTTSVAAGVVAAILRAAAHTIIFENEIFIALEMGAAGELLNEDRNITQANCGKWITAYAASGDRRAAQEAISLRAARDQKRADAVIRQELRERFDADGLRRAWEAFKVDGWCVRIPAYGAAIYNKIGQLAIRSLLSSDKMAQAKTNAIASARRELVGYYKREFPLEELQDTTIFGYHWKAQLVRAYFETLREKCLEIDWQETQHTPQP